MDGVSSQTHAMPHHGHERVGSEAVSNQVARGGGGAGNGSEIGRTFLEPS